MIDPKLVTIFNEHDYDNSGTIGISELKDTLADCNVKKTDGELLKIMKEVDVDGNGELSLDEFVLIFGQAQLKKVFDEIARGLFFVCIVIKSIWILVMILKY